MPKILLTHPTQTPMEQLLRHYAGLAVQAMKPGREGLSAEEVTALAVFAELPTKVVENPLYPDELSLQPINPFQIYRPSPDAPLEVMERHAVDLKQAREVLSLKLVNGTIQ